MITSKHESQSYTYNWDIYGYLQMEIADNAVILIIVF